MTEYIDPNLQAYLVSDLYVNALKLILRETIKAARFRKYTVLDRQCIIMGIIDHFKETSHDLINCYFYRKSE